MVLNCQRFSHINLNNCFKEKLFRDFIKMHKKSRCEKFTAASNAFL